MTEAAPTSAPNDSQVRSLLKQALDLLNRNELAAAEATLERVLAHDLENADALQLMGVLRRMQGRPAEAEQFYRRAIVCDPGLAQAHHNLGNLLRTLGRYQEAVAEEREAIRIKPNYIDAHLGLGLSLQSLGQYEAAERAFRDTLRLQPNYLLAKQSLGAVLNDLKRPKEAESVMRQALAASTRDQRQTAALLHNLGVSLKMQRRYAEALAAISRAQALAPEMPLAEYNRANVLQHLGRDEEAAEAYRNAVIRNPLDLNAHRDLNHLLYRQRRDEEFLHSYDDAIAMFPEAGQLYLAKASFQLYVGDLHGAEEGFRRAAALLPKHISPHDGLGLVYARLGRFGDAIREHEIAIGMEPQNVPAWANYTETLIRADEIDKALAAAEEAMRVDPQNQHALAMWGLALRKLDDPREQRLNDYEGFVQIFEISPPDGYSTIEAFNRDLNAYLDRLHRDKREHLDQTLRGGTQTVDDIFGVGHDPVERLRARIDEAIAAYISRMKDDSNHPLLRRRSAQFAYAGSWSSRLHDCGFHTNHVHPKGWISSAYYVAVPDAVENATEKQGWLKFGEPAFDAGLAQPVRRTIKPVPGTLVLFPSYMWHGTAPFHSRQSRTTIAFDVVPR